MQHRAHSFVWVSDVTAFGMAMLSSAFRLARCPLGRFGESFLCVAMCLYYGVELLACCGGRFVEEEDVITHERSPVPMYHSLLSTMPTNTMLSPQSIYMKKAELYIECVGAAPAYAIPQVCTSPTCEVAMQVSLSVLGLLFTALVLEIISSIAEVLVTTLM